MFNSAAAVVDRIWGDRLAAYPDRFDNVDLTGDQVTVPAHIDVELSGGVMVGGFDCEVCLTHDGSDWEITGVEYRSEFGGPSDSFDVAYLRKNPSDGSFRDLLRREILQLIDHQYNALADDATVKAREAYEA